LSGRNERLVGWLCGLADQPSSPAGKPAGVVEKVFVCVAIQPPSPAGKPAGVAFKSEIRIQKSEIRN
jgi:hypothetical protein